MSSGVLRWWRNVGALAKFISTGFWRRSFAFLRAVCRGIINGPEEVRYAQPNIT